MESLWVYLPVIMAIACPVSMGLMMWYMNRSQGQNMGGMNMTAPTHSNAQNTPVDKDSQIAALREQLQIMQEQVHALETPTPNAKE